MADEIIELAPAGADRAHGLGALRWAGSGECESKIAFRHLLILLSLLAAGFGGLYSANKAPPDQQLASWLVTGGLAAAFLIAGLLMPRRAGETIRIEAYDQGVVYHDGVHTHTVRWPEVATVAEARIDIRYDNGPTQRIHNLVLTTLDGDEHALELGDLLDSERFAALVHEATLPHLIPRVADKLHFRRPVPYGPLALHPEGLTRDGDELAWEDMAAVGIENGVLVILRKDDRRPWAEVPCGEIPNVQVLLYLIKARAQGEALAPPAPIGDGDEGRPGASRYSAIDRYRHMIDGPRVGY